ncbi:MAG: MvaI/BcnI family restriction endonuclease [Anaerolineales bacterium]|nr:MvaI/BcnI family restriction endonuclease [Anaerolineales bacterium]
MPKNTMTLSKFTKSFDKLKSKNWVKSKRKGATGIGHTLEKLIGLPENNIASPDLGEIELKAHRINSSSMITLFTFNRKVWKMKPLDAIKKYGTPDGNGRLGLYFTMSRTPNSTGLFLHIESETISTRHVSGEIIAEWQLQVLAERFIEKIPALILVSAFSEMRGDDEWFKFDRAQFLTGTSAEIIRSQILAGNILVDLRLHDKITSVRNHGTGFRAHEDKLPLLFQTVKDL